MPSHDRVFVSFHVSHSAKEYLNPNLVGEGSPLPSYEPHLFNTPVGSGVLDGPFLLERAWVRYAPSLTHKKRRTFVLLFSYSVATAAAAVVVIVIAATSATAVVDGRKAAATAAFVAAEEEQQDQRDDDQPYSGIFENIAEATHI